MALLRELYEPQESLTVSAVILDGDSILVGLSNHEDERQGKWIFPGGHVKDDETVESGAARECYEETGVECDIEDTKKAGNHYFAFGHSLGGKPHPGNKEFQQVKWMPVNEYLDLDDSYDSDREAYLSWSNQSTHTR